MNFIYLCCKNGITASILLVMALIQNKQWSVSASSNILSAKVIHNLSQRPDISVHLRKLSEYSTSHISLLAGTALPTGYFYAEYSSGSNCNGTVNYVEGYATGVCLPKTDTSGVQVGSMIQTCSNMGISCNMSIRTCL
jgi:hypothetical protein